MTNWVEGLLLSIPSASRRATKAGSPYTKLTGEFRKLAAAGENRTPGVEEKAAKLGNGAILLCVCWFTGFSVSPDTPGWGRGATHRLLGVEVREFSQRLPRELEFLELLDLGFLHLAASSSRVVDIVDSLSY